MTTLISFYTKDWQYPQHAKRLKRECDALGIPSVIQELPSTGSYLKNTCLKPQFILDKLKELKSPVLWVDVDGSVLQKPKLTYKIDVTSLESPRQEYAESPLSSGFDFAARRMAETRSRTWHVGTMWFNYTPAMIEFLEKWIENTGRISDESALEKTWQDHGWMIETYNLPPEYFYIERRGKPIPQGTVIMHRISSGESKKKEEPIAVQMAKDGVW